MRHEYPDHPSDTIVIYCSEDRVEQQRRDIWDALGTALGRQAPGGTTQFVVKGHREVLMEDVVTLASVGAKRVVLIDHINCLGRAKYRGRMTREEELADIRETQAVAREELAAAGLQVVAELVIDMDQDGVWRVIDVETGKPLEAEQLKALLQHRPSAAAGPAAD